ncbi:MAG: DUF6473 family protein [Paracoccaceae bacterium]
MSIERTSASALDYLPCRYGNSRLLFRGPRRALDGPYTLFLGDSLTYGKFVVQPFPSLVEQALGRECINFGSLNAGIDSFVHDADVMNAANGAEVTVLQILGAQNLSNRFYRVHPRRNDRFLSPSPMLQAAFRGVDFTEINFNKHLLSKLQTVSPDRFDIVRTELQQAWIARMKLLLSNIQSSVVLLWLRSSQAGSELGDEPLLVDRGMIDAVRDKVLDVVELDLGALNNPEDMEGMHFDPMDLPAAMHLPGPMNHARIASHVATALRAIS